RNAVCPPGRALASSPGCLTWVRDVLRNLSGPGRVLPTPVDPGPRLTLPVVPVDPGLRLALPVAPVDPGPRTGVLGCCCAGGAGFGGGAVVVFFGGVVVVWAGDPFRPAAKATVIASPDKNILRFALESMISSNVCF